MEKQIILQSDGYELEALLSQNTSDRAAVITHPHPLYGGNMYNPVVETLASAYRQNGWTTLRFNFRGTGNSQGCFGNGVGETSDVRAAIDYLASNTFKQVHLAGYSFGAWVNSLWATQYVNHSATLVMVSPPVAFLSFDGIGKLPGLKLVIAGGKDEIAPAASIRDLLAGWNPGAELLIIEEADHFYSGQLERISRAIGKLLAR